MGRKLRQPCFRSGGVLKRGSISLSRGGGRGQKFPAHRACEGAAGSGALCSAGRGDTSGVLEGTVAAKGSRGELRHDSERQRARGVNWGRTSSSGGRELPAYHFGIPCYLGRAKT